MHVIIFYQFTMQICFLPDAAFWKLPFGNFKFKGSFLIKRVPVVQAPSLLSLKYASALWKAIYKMASSPKGFPLKVGLEYNLSFAISFLCFAGEKYGVD